MARSQDFKILLETTPYQQKAWLGLLFILQFFQSNLSVENSLVIQKKAVH